MPQQPPTNISCSAASISTSIHYPTKVLIISGTTTPRINDTSSEKRRQIQHHSMPPSKLVGPWQMNLRSKG
uniref:Uncharacterized protein n=3 Tax=Loa loa TaxID=7209 RepID=A0A1I7V7A0_LOALO